MTTLRFRPDKAPVDAAPFWESPSVQLWHGDARDLSFLADGSVQTCITSPPYWGLRVYSGVESSVWGGARDCAHEWGSELYQRQRGSLHGTNAQVGNTLAGVSGAGVQQGRFCSLCGAWWGNLGREPSPELYLAHLVQIFREVKRVLRSDGVLCLNMGDSYAGSWGSMSHDLDGKAKRQGTNQRPPSSYPGNGLKPLDLCNIPHRVAQALQADGWYWRGTVIWAKNNPMPESISGWRWERCCVKVKSQDYSEYSQPGKVSSGEISGGHRNRDAHGGVWEGGATYTDCPGCAKCENNDGLVLRKGAWRPTTAHEYIFMLTKSPVYFSDQEAVREPHTDVSVARYLRGSSYDGSKPYAMKHGPSGHGVQKWDTEGAPQWVKGHSGYVKADGTLMINESGRNLRSVWSFSTQGFGLEMCLACGKIYDARQYRRLGMVKIEVVDEETEEVSTKEVKRCNRCQGTEWMSHFATFPEALPEKCILASTSEAGCCAKCGSPMVRIVSKKAATMNIRVRDAKRGVATAEEGYKASAVEIAKYDAEDMGDTKTIGFRPSCTCNAGVVPSVVLDPFAGSGTTCLVAQKLGRRGIGIDLSLHYLALSKKRLKEVPLPLALAEGMPAPGS